MAKTRQEKEKTIQELSEGLKTAKSAVFANFQGLKVGESEELRRQCREQNITYLASKKTLLKRALDAIGLDVDIKKFDGGVAVVLGKEDEVSAAQTVAKFAKDHKTTSIFGGILEGQLIDETKVKELSILPSKLELYAKLVGTINAPVSGFVNVLAGNMRGLVNVLNSIKETKS